MESFSYWGVFFSAALAINVSPGPDLIYILSNTLAGGRKVGIASSLGVCSGALVHVLAAALGLSTILVTSALAFRVVQYVGAAYLVYLGVRALASKGTSIDMAERSKRGGRKMTPRQAFRQGVLVDVLNPKVAIFFMAFLPQFVRPELGNPAAQIAVLGGLVILVAVVVECAVVMAAARTTDFLRRNPRCSIWLDRVLGSVLVGLGLRLAFLEGGRGA
ncbi:MAG: LysE family translocator [Deltaproteobacteria bacterium]|nr:LysE family translocator [Deltaproteobacteria bacterium]